MSIDAVGMPETYRGRTTIRPQAIRRVAEAVTAELAGVSAGAVRAELADARGALSVSVTTPLQLGAAASAGMTLVERAAAIVETVVAQLDAVAGRTVGRVEVRFSGLRASTTKARRVR